MKDASKCIINRCYRKASYGTKGEPPLYCFKDRNQEEDMIYLNGAQCDIQPCDEKPVYGYKNQKKTHCKKHTLPNMLDLTRKICKEGDCGTTKDIV